MLPALLLPLLSLAGAACPEHPAPAHGTIVASVWVPGGLAIRCPYGLVPLGTGLATCLGDAWSEQLECGEAVALLLGGNEEAGYSLRAELYSGGAACPDIPHLPQPVHGAAGGWVGGLAVLCGGEPQPFGMTAECFGYSVQDNLWLELPSLQAAKSMASGVAVDGALLLMGGYDSDYYQTDTSEVWVPGLGIESPWRPQPSLPHKRSDHCSVVLPSTTGGPAVVVTGNYPEVPTENMAETTLLQIEPDTGALTWTPLADMATGRDEHGCSQVSTDGAYVEVMVAGGPKTGKAEIYDIQQDAWRPAAPLPHTAHGPGMAVLDGKPTVMGGYELESEPRNQDRVVQYNVATDSWVELAPLQAPRSHPLTIAVPRALFCP